MQDKRRAAFLTSNEEAKVARPESSLEDKIRVISKTKISNVKAFNQMFDDAVKRQAERRKAIKMKNQDPVYKPVESDDMFADIDNEMGF